jgi:hypothetical protein
VPAVLADVPLYEVTPVFVFGGVVVLAAAWILSLSLVSTTRTSGSMANQECDGRFGDHSPWGSALRRSLWLPRSLPIPSPPLGCRFRAGSDSRKRCNRWPVLGVSVIRDGEPHRPENDHGEGN